VRLIHQGHSTLEIVTELQNKFDLLGNEVERELYANVGRLRTEIAEFRSKAPTLAGLGFRRGYSWKEVVTVLESAGLLSGNEIVSYCLTARDRAAHMDGKSR
jgi:hypothetical protein